MNPTSLFSIDTISKSAGLIWVGFGDYEPNLHGCLQMSASLAARNDGETNVWYVLLTANGDVGIEFIPLEYDSKSLATEMKEENLPQEFIDTILTGWWTACLEILPAKERVRGKY